MRSITTPKESFIAAQGTSKGLPDIWIVNSALEDLTPKEAFAWHLSVIVACKHTVGAGLPTKEENTVLAGIGDAFDENLTRDANAVRLARITWNSTRQLLYRVRNPELANTYLRAVIEQRSCPREFEYRMEQDPTWKLAEPALAIQHRTPDTA